MPVKKTNQDQLPIIFEKPNINTLLSEDDEIIKFRQIVNMLDYSKFYKKIGKKGAPSFKPEVMLSVILLGISEGIMASRKIERRCKKDIDFIYLTDWGMPDHSTIARFITNNKEEIEDLHKQFTRIVIRAKISRFNEFAMDGTQIESCSSKGHSYGEQKLDEQAERLSRAISKGLEQIRKNDLSEEAKEKRLKKITKQKEYLELCKTSKVKLIERKKTILPKHRAKHQINVKEEESRYMSKLGGCGYNVQYVTDTSSGIIVGCNVVSEISDTHLFKPNVEMVESIIGKKSEAKFIADSGYLSGETLSYVEKNQIDAVIYDAVGQKGRPSREAIEKGMKTFSYFHYTYDESTNRYLCPNDKYLEEIEPAVYECKDCQECPYKEKCFKRGKNKKITKTEFQKQRIAMMGKANYEESMNRRKIVERNFGQLKWNLGFRRFTRKDLSGARVETSLIALAMNIKKVLKYYYQQFMSFLRVFLMFLFVKQIKLKKIIKKPKLINSIPVFC